MTEIYIHIVARMAGERTLQLSLVLAMALAHLPQAIGATAVLREQCRAASSCTIVAGWLLVGVISVLVAGLAGE